MAEIPEMADPGAEFDDDGFDEEVPLETPEAQQEDAPRAGFMSARDVQAMLDAQQARMLEHLERVQAPRRDAPPPPPPDPGSRMPTQQEVRRAFESGDPDQFMDIYARGLQAVYDAADQRVRGLEQTGMQRIQELSREVVKTAVPEYQEYGRAAEKIMDEFGITGDLRANTQVVKLMIDAAKGRNLDGEVTRAVEARRRRAASRGTADTTSTRGVGSGDTEPVFSIEAMQTLRRTGRAPDRHAQALGYANWAEYEAATARKYETWQEDSVPAWRKRLNARRGQKGRTRT